MDPSLQGTVGRYSDDCGRPQTEGSVKHAVISTSKVNLRFPASVSSDCSVARSFHSPTDLMKPIRSFETCGTSYNALVVPDS